MQPRYLPLILALVASTHARDDWSWGPDDTQEFSSRSGSASGRSLTFPNAKVDRTLSSSVQQPSLQRAPSTETVRVPRLVLGGTSGQSVSTSSGLTFSQGVSLPLEQTFSQGPALPQGQTFSPPPSQGFVPSISETFPPAEVNTFAPAPAVQHFPPTHTLQVAQAVSSIEPHPIGNQLKGESRNDKPRGDGQAEARFLGLKEKFCEYGIGYDCKKGFDKGHHHGTGISAYDVSYVQPVQVVPVGGPIAAVPIDKGHKKGFHDKGHHHSPPAYYPPQPTYHAPQPAYHPPATGYGAPATGYGAPAYHPPQSSYGVPASSYASPASYTPPKSSYGGGQVQHVHTHHHVYNGQASGGGFAYGKDNSLGSSSSHFSTFGNSVKKVGSALPAIPPRENFLTEQGSLPGFLEDCQCVERRYCSSLDIVGRSNDQFLHLDARSKKTDILSTASGENDTVATSSEDGLSFSASEIKSTQTEAKESGRQKRDTFFGSDAKVQPIVQPTSRQGRQFRFGGYSPGVSGCAASHVCCRSPVFRSERAISTCGRRSSVGLLGRVKNNRFETGDTEFGEYPWQAAILRRESGDNVYVCGAVLIDTRHLLTAAHCVNGLSPSDLKVRLGEWDVSSETEFYRYIETPVSGVYPHREFFSGNLNNDIAVLRLFSHVNLATNPHVSPVCLPERSDDFTGQRCHATGWGKNAFGNTGDFQHLLKEVDVPMVSHSSCESALRRTRLGSNFNLHDGMTCAGGEEGKDACEGDGGSPLVCRGFDGSMVLAGLVSWGVGCGTRGVPGVYVNVPYYLDWINSITKS
ncbi:uncharacterized protein [Palaemon carinicauda]